MKGARAVALAIIGILLFFAAPAFAHPLGNFTINHYSRIELQADAIRIRYVLDFAEIPTFQEMPAIDRDRDGLVSEPESQAYLGVKAAEHRRGLTLVLNGAPAELTLSSHELSFSPGQGGLPILRLSYLFEAPLAQRGGEPLSVQYRDDNYADRLGWREIVVRPAESVRLLDSNASLQDRTNELRDYPSDLLRAPLDQRDAQVTFVPEAGASTPRQPSTTVAQSANRPLDAFASLIAARELSLPVVLFSLVAALILGALHALSPGHGKTIMAAYLIGTRGTARQAILLGLVVTVSHTVGVFALGLATLYASRHVLPERLYPWLGLVSGLIVVVLGVGLVVGRLRRARSATQAHDLLHGHHEGEQADHGHSHLPVAPPASTITWRSLVALGFAGGLLPSASALVVFLSAISLQRLGFGMILITAFGLGMAVVLTGTGLLLVYASKALLVVGRLLGSGRLQRVIAPALPLASALVVVVAGLALTAQALSQVSAIF